MGSLRPAPLAAAKPSTEETTCSSWRDSIWCRRLHSSSFCMLWACNASLRSPSPTPATIPQQTLTSFHEEEAKREMEGGDEFIEIKVTDPHKVGDGMSSYIAYKVVTNTNLSYFKKSKPEVNRRFSDFLGLRDK